MDRCSRCGREIGFIKRKDKKPLVVNKNPSHFIPDKSGDMYFIYDGEMRKGRIAQDGLRGYTLHNC
ncbi:hypothetical protein [Tissierella sp. Yu-01]|uniref:hypothetical protein n=1 Tax=Tissierella sp. Yu-01 TaxID=3035694 RepID=UPI00240E3FE5|nr:hypothetical protein [Tissierella sp. Yu-01]WFA10367.1 hypothetical protein P3962_07385 [Tissierella sp. Yu-01]